MFHRKSLEADNNQSMISTLSLLCLTEEKCNIFQQFITRAYKDSQTLTW